MNAGIFVAEDDALTVAQMEKYIGEMGHRFVGSADSAERALGQIRNIRPDLTLMDIRLKGAMDGVSAAETLREERGIGVLYVTAYADDQLLARAKLTEPYGYLVKPFNREGLQASIEVALYKCEMERERQKLLSRVKRLEGLLSICMQCKKIRAENNDWQQLEQYIVEHSDAVFSHGLCPSCFEIEMKKMD